MNTILRRNVLIAGDTPRWIESVKNALPKQYDARVRTDSLGAIEALFFEEQSFDLCILAQQMPEKNDGVMLLSEIRDDNNMVPVIIFSDHVDLEASKKITALKGVVVRHEDGSSALASAIETLLPP